jgi:secreted Zn-dependent insulinase-like peptidase
MSENGGYSNAYTENEFTNYQFKISLDHLQMALDMQANLLASPLLKKEGMEREIQAVDSEFEGNFPYDSVREELILQQNINIHNHPCTKFGWGNLKTLTGIETGKPT